MPIMGHVIDVINPDSLGTDVYFLSERPAGSWDGQGSRLILSMVGGQRLAVRVIVPSGRMVWQSLSPIFRRVGPGPLVLGAAWNNESFSVSVNSRLIASPTGPGTDDPIVFGDWDIADETAAFEKRSTKMRKKRRSTAQQLSQAQFRRLSDLLIAEIQNLKRDLKDHRSGALSRILSVMGVLRKLVVRTDGNALLQRVAGYVDAPLDVYSSPLEAIFGPNVGQIIQAGHFGDGLTVLSRLNSQAVPYARTHIDFDVWLQQKNWIHRRDTESNEAVIQSCGNKTGSHADADETSLMEEARKIWVPDHLGRNGLNLWILAVAEVVVHLAEHNVFPLIPPELGFQNAIRSCGGIR